MHAPSAVLAHALSPRGKSQGIRSRLTAARPAQPPHRPEAHRPPPMQPRCIALACAVAVRSGACEESEGRRQRRQDEGTLDKS